MTSLHQLSKILIDFEYMNNIYSITTEPYKTLSELKESITKKIFPSPKNIHCFYKNIDIHEQEDEQIYRLFPFRKKLKIRLKQPSKEKIIIKSYKSYKNLYTKSRTNLPENKEWQSKFEFVSNLSPKIPKKIGNIKNTLNSNNNKEIKKRLLSFSSMQEKPKNKKKSKDLFELIEDEYLKNDELFYYLHKNKINKYKLLNKEKFNDNKNDINDIFSEKSSIINNETNPKKSNNKLSLNIKKFKKEDNFNSIYIKDKCQTQREKEEIKVKSYEEKRNENENNEDYKLDNKLSHTNNKVGQTNPINNLNEKKENIDENYICSLCKNKIISSYCLKCNQFICKNCLGKCKSDKHENIEIKINEDCFSNINLYGLSIISNIDKKVKYMILKKKEII